MIKSKEEVLEYYREYRNKKTAEDVHGDHK